MIEPLQNFKYDLDASAGKDLPGGSAKEVTVDEFPIAASMAGVSIRLKAGALRELHWHAIAAEWGYVVSGSVRTRPSTTSSRRVMSGTFPKAIPTCCRGLDLRNATLCWSSITATSRNLARLALRTGGRRLLPKFSVATPDSGERRLPVCRSKRCTSSRGKFPVRHKTPSATGPRFRANSLTSFGSESASPIPGQAARNESWTTDFPISTTISGVIPDLKKGGLRELHWHPNADEWQYYIKGRAQVGTFGAHGRSKVEEFGPGQVAFIKQGFGHYIQQIGDEETQILITFNSPNYQEISLSTWLSNHPAQIIADNFGLSLDEVARTPKTKQAIMGPHHRSVRS